MAKGAMRILSLEAKDIIIAMAADNDAGNKIRDDNNQVFSDKFDTALDLSLDRMQLAKACRDKGIVRKMYIKGVKEDKNENKKIDDDKTCFLAVISVTFKCNLYCHDFEFYECKYKNNIYIRR